MKKFFNKKNGLILLLIVTVIILILAIIKISGKAGDVTTKNKLTCKKITRDNYTLTYKISYKNNKANNVTLIFRDNKSDRNMNDYFETTSDINKYLRLKPITYTYVDNDITIILNNKTYENNKDESLVTDLFKSYDKEKKYLESIDFECE